MDVNDPQFKYLLQSCDAALEVIRRRLKENDGWLGYRVLELMILPVSEAQRRKPAKKTSSWVPPQHIRVIQQYAQGKKLAEIAREENSSRGTILRILRTAPLRLLQLCGIIKVES